MGYRVQRQPERQPTLLLLASADEPRHERSLRWGLTWCRRAREGGTGCRLQPLQGAGADGGAHGRCARHAGGRRPPVWERRRAEVTQSVGLARPRGRRGHELELAEIVAQSPRYCTIPQSSKGWGLARRTAYATSSLQYAHTYTYVHLEMYVAQVCMKYVQCSL